MKKRMIALMLAGIMVLSVTACGGGGASSKNQNNQDDGESKQVGVEVTEDMQSAPPEDAPVGGQVPYHRICTADGQIVQRTLDLSD